VYKNTTLLTLTTDYSVTINSNGTGSVTLVSAATGSDNITLVGNRSVKRSTDFVTGGDLFANSLNDEFDSLVIFSQQIKEEAARGLKAPITDPTDVNMVLPVKSSRKGKVLAFDSTTGNPVNGPSLDAMVTVIEQSDNINTVADNIDDVNTVAGISSNVTTVAGISGNVTTVAGISSNVTTVAGVSSNVTTVAGISAAVSGVAAISSAVSGVNSNSTNINAVNSNATNINTCATNIAAIIDAPTQAASAAASATAAAASAASGMYSAVQDKSANYTVVSGDAGDLIRVTTTSGAITITLPAISSVSDGFKVAIVKWTSDANAVNINRSGSDTINGATTAQIGSQYSQIILVADAETSTWFASQSGLGATNVNVDVFSGNASTTAFTLSSDPSSKNNTYVSISGVYQAKSTYSVSGTTLTFSTAPPSGTSNIEIVYGTPLAIGTPSDGTVSTAKIVDGAVTSQKMAAGAGNVSGEIKMWPTASAPTGFLLCAGAAVSRATYAALFAVIGTTFGAGDGSTTFNLPDFRDRMPIGAGTTYSANSQGGSKDAVIPSHSHAITDPGHSHTFRGGNATGSGNVFQATSASLGSAISATATGSVVSTTTGITGTNSTGSSATDANLPPYLGVYFIIKT
jgi:microcystin-dependent protein